MTRKLEEVEADARALAAERRDAPMTLAVTGRAVFMGYRAMRTYTVNEKTTSVLPFTVYVGERASVVACETSDPDVMQLVTGLVDGEAIILAGQLVSSRGRFGLWVRVKVTSVSLWMRKERRPE